ncbi:MAG: aldo/keto reductase [Pseudonocardiales bacterium]|nr:aldo/keto reductase [Pseudonocardiales bacterium]
MEQRFVGRSGLRVSELALGTMTWGRETDADVASAQLRAFRDAGGTLVDTAPSYGDGRSESILGGLLSDASARDELVIATKAGLRQSADGPLVDASRRGLLSALDASLVRLRVDHVDLWQVHTVDPVTPFEETLAALDSAVDSGKVRYVGVSNYGGWRLAQSATWQRALPGRAPIVSDQVEYSLLERGIEREVVPFCIGHGVGVVSYSPLGGGTLTGKYRDNVPSDSRAATGEWGVADYASRRAAGIVEAVAIAAEGLGASPVAMALGWIRQRPGVASSIIGARTLAQLNAALQTLSVVIPIEIRTALDEVSAPVLGYPEDAR